MAAPVVNAEYLKEIKRARRDLRALISNEKCAPIMLRLAWHNAGTYDSTTKKGGPDGTIRFKKVYEQEANNGLKYAIDLCGQVKAKHPKITYADLYQLAGVVAVEVTGGPTIFFVAGRKDSKEYCAGGPLPSAHEDASHLRQVFYRMDLNDKDIVALSGGHTLGQAHPDRSDFSGPWTKNPLKFDNSYFVELMKLVKPEANERSKEGPKEQSEKDSEESKQGDSQKLLNLPTDKALVEDPKLRVYVEKYAKDEEAFFADYAASHKKLSELGFSHSFHSITSPTTVKVVVAAAVVILGFIFELHRTSKRV